MILPITFLILVTLLLSSYLSASTAIIGSIFKTHLAEAQSYIQTIKYRNLVIDLGNGLKTNAQLTIPAIGNGPFPGVLLVHSSGALDMNETLAKNTKPFWQISQYLSERGFVVLRYDKRGIGANSTIIDHNIWGNTTVNSLIHDAEIALDVLMHQPMVDPNRISIIGHSEGTAIGARVAIDNPNKVKNIVLMGTVAENFSKIAFSQFVSAPLSYANRVLDHNHSGLISIQQIATDPLFIKVGSIFYANNTTKALTNALAQESGNERNSSGYVSIDGQLRPFLVQIYNNSTAFNLSKCNGVDRCPILVRSESNLEPTLSIIGNVSKSTGILILNGENDSETPVQEAFLLQQKLAEVNHPDHTLITYPGLGHLFYPSSQWITASGPIERYVLSDLFAWLSRHKVNTAIHDENPQTNTGLASLVINK